MTIIIAGTVILAFIYDSSGTAKLVATSLSIGGMTWIFKKITEQVNKDASQIISFAGYSMAGVSVVKIIGNAMGSVDTVVGFFVRISGGIERVANFFDKLTFWN